MTTREQRAEIRQRWADNPNDPEFRKWVRELCDESDERDALRAILDDCQRHKEQTDEDNDALRAEVERLREVYRCARGMCGGQDWNKGTAAYYYRNGLVEAVNRVETLHNLDAKRDSLATDPPAPRDAPEGPTDSWRRSGEPAKSDYIIDRQALGIAADCIDNGLDPEACPYSPRDFDSWAGLADWLAGRESGPSEPAQSDEDEGLEADRILANAPKPPRGGLYIDENGEAQALPSDDEGAEALSALTHFEAAAFNGQRLHAGLVREYGDTIRRGIERQREVSDYHEGLEEGMRIERQGSEAQHPDDAAVDRFAESMKSKLAKARAKGRGGWDDPDQCAGTDLAEMLVDHVEKENTGTFEDVANFAMMLHQRGESPRVLAWAMRAYLDRHFREIERQRSEQGEPAAGEAWRRVRDTALGYATILCTAEDCDAVERSLSRQQVPSDLVPDALSAYHGYVPPEDGEAGSYYVDGWNDCREQVADAIRQHEQGEG